MPYGWRKAAKGRTVWRIVEEVISQGLESQVKSLGFDSVAPADSEVGVYDFKYQYDGRDICVSSVFDYKIFLSPLNDVSVIISGAIVPVLLERSHRAFSIE